MKNVNPYYQEYYKFISILMSNDKDQTEHLKSFFSEFNIDKDSDVYNNFDMHLLKYLLNDMHEFRNKLMNQDNCQMIIEKTKELIEKYKDVNYRIVQLLFENRAIMYQDNITKEENEKKFLKYFSDTINEISTYHKNINYCNYYFLEFLYLNNIFNLNIQNKEMKLIIDYMFKILNNCYLKKEEKFHGITIVMIQLQEANQIEDFINFVIDLFQNNENTTAQCNLTQYILENYHNFYENLEKNIDFIHFVIDSLENERYAFNEKSELITCFLKNPENLNKEISKDKIKSLMNITYKHLQEQLNTQLKFKEFKVFDKQLIGNFFQKNEQYWDQEIKDFMIEQFS